MPARLLSLGWFVLFASSTVAAAPLHQRIDQAIAAKPGFAKQAAALASDAEFLRRLTLDLTGTIPTSAEARAFLDDKSPKKREQLIDRLLASPENARHLATFLDITLMERRADKLVTKADWQQYLRTAMLANKPWDVLAKEILAADGSDPKTRPAAKFYLDRDGEPHLITRDLGRLFLGMNFTCAQCHDHPLVRPWKQDYYYGIFAFVNRSYLFTDKDKKVVYAEKAEGEASYQNVFDTSKTTKTSGPRLPHQTVALKEPTFEKGKEYKVAPAANVRPVPQFSRREHLPELIAGPDNVPFRRNIANRLWASLMGRGLVHPLDWDHADNPPSHPELLTLLADEIAALKFDMRAFLRELALSQTYQCSSELPKDVKDPTPELFAVFNIKPLSPEPLAYAVMQATGLTDIERQTLGKKLTEEALAARLAPQVATFVRTFGKVGEAEDKGFEATLDQALFLNNGDLFSGWLAPKAGNLTDRLAKLKDAELADELYLSVLTRRPDDVERQEIARYLKARGGAKADVLSDLVWALVTSAEFRFNH